MHFLKNPLSVFILLLIWTFADLTAGDSTYCYDVSRSLFLYPMQIPSPDQYAIWQWDYSQQVYTIQNQNQKRDILTIYLRNRDKKEFLDVWVIRSDRPYGNSCIEDLHAYVKMDGTLDLHYDSGELSWRVNRPETVFHTETLPRYQIAAPSGSSADVRIQKEGFVRVSDTGYPDDIKLEDGVEVCVTHLPPGDLTFSDLTFSPLTIRKNTP